MKSVKLHVTDLDSFSWYQKLDNMTDEEMRNRLLRLEPAKEIMNMGTAWHSVMEEATKWHSIVNIPFSVFTKAMKGGFTFHIECDSEIVLPQVCEIRAQKVYCVDGYQVTLTGKTDGITGNKIDDHKLTFNPQPENYLEAFQWRAYLDIFNADIFEYIIYSAKQDEKSITIYDISKIKLYRYPKMINDIETGIRNLLEFVKNRVPEMIERN